MSKPTGKTYEIVTARDFQAIPADRIAECLNEFGLWLTMHAELQRLLGQLGPEPVAAWDGVFRWVDDGKGQYSITFKPPTETPS